MIHNDAKDQANKQKTEIISSQFTQKDVIVKHRERVYDGFFKLDKLRFDHMRFDGSWQKNVVREVMVRGDAACVLPFDPIRQEVVLIEQIRVGAFGKTASPWMIETVAGLIDKKDEDPSAVASREALEEAGVTLTCLIPACEYFASIGGSDEKTYLYIGLCDTSKIGGIHGLGSEHEDIRAFTVPLTEAMTLLNTGKIQNAALLIALLWLNQNRDQYQQDVNTL